VTGPRALLLALLEGLSHRRLAVGAIAAATVVLAIVSLFQMPLQLLPEIRYPQIRIIGDLPGQTSRVIEESINEPMEAALEGVPGIVQLESRSGDGRAYLDLFFEPDYDLDRALRDVTQAAQRAQSQIPPEFPEPRIFAVSTMEDPVIQFAFGSTTHSVVDLRQRIRANLLPRLRSIPGVDAVYLGREEVSELVIEVDPLRQASSGVRLDALEGVLHRATDPAPSSAMRTPSFEGIGVLGANGWDAGWLNRQPVPVEGTAQAIPLHAIGSAHRAPSEESLRTRLDGSSAVLVTVHRSPHAHSLRLAREAREVVEDVASASAMEGILSTVLYDDSVVTRSAVQSVVVAAVGGAFLAMILLFFTLRNRRYVPLVAAVVGVSLASAVVVLHAMGMTLNLLTLAGLLLSVGLGLDYAIIYLDRLDRLREGRGELSGERGHMPAGAEASWSADRSESDRRMVLDSGPPAQPAPAHLQAMVDVAGPLLGALLTTMAAVLPFLLVEGLVALLFRPLIWTVVVAAIFSFLFAVVLLSTFSRLEEEDVKPTEATPARSASGAGGTGGDRGTQAEAEIEPSDQRVPDRDGGVLGKESRGWRWARKPLLTWGGTVALLALLLLGGRALPFEVLPVVDDGFVDIRITHPVGIPAGEMDRLTRDVEAQLLALEGTGALFTTVGGYFREGLPSFRPGTANFMVRVDTDGGDRPSSSWAADARAAIGELNVTELGVSITLPRIRGVQTRLSDADLLVVLTEDSGDLLALTEVETQVMEILQGVEGLADVERVRGGVSPRWMAQPREDVLAAYGVMPATLAQAMEYALEGRVLRQRMENGEPLALRVRYDRREAGGPQDLAGVRVPSVAGGNVRFGDLVEFRLIEEPTHIERREGQRVVRVAAQLDPAGPGPGAVGESVTRALQEAELPSGVSWWLEGELDALQETSRTFGIAMALALAMILTLLVVQYGSLSFALAGLISIPLSGAGTVILLGLLSRPLDAMVLAGLLIAVGIVANNVILVLSQAQESMRGVGDRTVAGQAGGEWRTSPAQSGTAVGVVGRKDDPGPAVGGMELEEALRTAARDRLRPITLTVLSTVLGMSPLLWGGAEVFGLLQPLAIALTGALLVSIPLACFLLPGLVLGMVRLWEGVGNRVRSREA
jgi:multidrug efflux pump subunit AcrB